MYSTGFARAKMWHCYFTVEPIKTFLFPYTFWNIHNLDPDCLFLKSSPLKESYPTLIEPQATPLKSYHIITVVIACTWISNLSPDPPCRRRSTRPGWVSWRRWPLRETQQGWSLKRWGSRGSMSSWLASAPSPTSSRRCTRWTSGSGCRRMDEGTLV